MAEKRYYAHKHLLQENKVHDKICHNFMSLDETVEHINMYYQKYTVLKKENELLKQRNDRQCNQLKQLWELIENEDYNTLRSMLNQRETDEKLLQKEWQMYY